MPECLWGKEHHTRARPGFVFIKDWSQARVFREQQPPVSDDKENWEK